METIKPNGVIGSDRPRIDGVAKVTGQARYGADERAEHAAFAYLATAGIARGRIRAIDEQAARAVPGMLDILTHAKVEIGTGIRPVLAQTVADRLGVAAEAVEVVIGDSRLPAAALTAGSNSTNRRAGRSGDCPARCTKQPKLTASPHATSTATWPSTTCPATRTSGTSRPSWCPRRIRW